MDTAATPTRPSYVVITPARDEERHIERTIRSLTTQSVAPAQWIIVDDGSRDRTAEIIKTYAAQHSWITPVYVSDRGNRVNGTGPMQAFHRGLQEIRILDWMYLVKLDSDLEFAPDYFQKCLNEFERDPKLGVGGGVIAHKEGEELKVEQTPKFHVRGATKIYRRECWQAIGGLLAAPGWDTIDEVKANMHGWTSRSFPDLQLVHLRKTGAADGSWKNAVKDGRADYISGYHPIFMLLKCVKRLFQRPWAVGSAGLAFGYLRAYWRREAQVPDADLIKYIRRQQLRRLLLLDSIWK